MNDSWRTKADRIIGELSFQAWHAANHDKAGRRYKKHRPYTIPLMADRLVECLSASDELAAKQIFIYEYQYL